VSEEAPLLGIFVGGRARRMGGFPKGLLPASNSGESIVRHLLTLAGEAGLDAVLIGEAGPYANAAPGVTALADSPTGIGPLGGLAALLAHALGRHRFAIAVACDMPFVTGPVLDRLRSAPFSAQIVAARRTANGPFEPFLARYDAERVGAVLTRQLRGGTRSFQALFAACNVVEWPLTPEERAAWDDWDTPEDLPDWARGGPL